MNNLDINASQQVVTPSDFAILYIVNNNLEYIKYLVNSIQSVLFTHEVDIYVLCLNCSSLVKQILYKHNIYTKNIYLLDIEFLDSSSDLYNQFIDNEHEFQYIKPIAIKYLINNINFKNKKRFLYLDVDTFVIRNLLPIINQIDNQAVLIKEFGVDYDHFGWDLYINDKLLYNDSYFSSIKPEHRWKEKEYIPNTGVIGFDVNRDKPILDEWFQTTINILKKNLKSYIRWWDQGAIMVTLEKLNQKNILLDNKEFNDTFLKKDFKPNTVAHTSSHIIHFIGKPKVKLKKFIKSEQLTTQIDFLQIFVIGHYDQQFFSIQPRNYLSFINLENITYIKSEYAHNSLGESRIFLSDSIDYDKYNVIGTVSASWNKKYNPYKIDFMLNWPEYSLIERLQHSKSLVLCASMCKGVYADKKEPLWMHNFQKHFRQTHINSEDIELGLYKITNLKYSGIRPAPYANQIICHKTLFYDLRDFVRSKIDDIIEYFGIFPKYSVPDQNRPLAYILEELTMLWWANQQNIDFHSLVKVNPSWYA